MNLKLPSTPSKPKSPRTNKHKVKWHTPTEATQDQTEDTEGFMDTNERKSQDFEEDFSQRIGVDDLPQSDTTCRKKLNRNARIKAKGKLSTLKVHLFASSALLALAHSNGNPIIDSGENVLGLATYNLTFATPFNDENPYHILETEIPDTCNTTLSKAALQNMITMHHHGLFEDAKQPSCTPSSMIDHRITKTIVKEASTPGKSPSLRNRDTSEHKSFGQQDKSHG